MQRCKDFAPGLYSFVKIEHIFVKWYLGGSHSYQRIRDTIGKYVEYVYECPCSNANDMSACIHPKDTKGSGTFPEIGKGTSNPLELSTYLPQDKSKELIVQFSDFSLDVCFALYISLRRFKYSGLCANRLFCSR